MAKKQLTKREEFDIMKLVLDKFLLLGVIVMAIGVFLIVESVTFAYGIVVLAVGALVMILFAMLLIREYNFLQH